MTYRDEFDDPKDSKSKLLAQIGPKAAFFILLIALSFMVGVVWKLYIGANKSGEQAVPTLRADGEEYKVTPEDPGGMEIPNQDSTLFSSDEEKGGVENLLAEDESEDPMPRSQLFAGLNTESPDLHAEAQETPLDQPISEDAQRIVEQAEEAEQVVQNIVEDGVDAVVAEKEGVGFEVMEEMPAKVEPSMEVTVTEPEAETQPVIDLSINSNATEPAAEVQAEAAPQESPVAAPAAGDYFIQLASVQDREKAEAEWLALQKKYTQLQGYSYRVESADLGARGTYYRIQAGPVAKDEANALCDSIKRITPNGCLVKKK